MPPPLADLKREDLQTPDLVYQIALPPSRIALLTSISGLDFDDAWKHRLNVPIADLLVPCLGRSDFIRNKRAAGRRRDLADISMLEEQEDDAQ